MLKANYAMLVSCRMNPKGRQQARQERQQGQQSAAAREGLHNANLVTLGAANNMHAEVLHMILGACRACIYWGLSLRLWAL